MATCLIDGDAAQLVCGAGKLHLLFPIQVGHVEKGELPNVSSAETMS